MSSNVDLPLALIADDHANIRRILRHYLEAAGYRVLEARDGTETKSLLSEEVSVALLDLQMPGASGLECLDYSRERFPSTQVIMLSAVGGINDAVQAMKRGAFWYLSKPFEREELTALVARATELARVTSKNVELISSLGSIAVGPEFIAKSQVMSELMETLDRVATLDSTVLVTGESGTGKTAIARLLHNKSGRKNKPFVALSCAALPRDLLEAELFGHERGAYTGAVNSRPGSIEVGEGGTLFLDEIGDLPLDLQPKLLTFLQDKVFRRIGSTKERTANVRVITATNADLEGLCAQKLFREELFYRINVITLRVPALRERRDDITPLANSILERIANKRGSQVVRLSKSAVTALENHTWPGNVRELENMLERVTALNDTQEISAELLKLNTSVGTCLKEKEPFEEMTLEQLERRAIQEMLVRCDGNKAEAAKRLGISLKSIYNKLAQKKS